jgi:DNA repair protein RecN (Recombination protein N)
MEVKKNLERAGQVDSQLKIRAENLAEPVYHVEDLVEELRRDLSKIQPDEKRLEAVEERLDTLNKLKRKYGGSLIAVNSKLASIMQELAGVENIAQKISSVETQLSQLHAKLAEGAMTLSQKRKQTAKDLAKKVVAELATLRMSPADFEVLLQTIPAGERTHPNLTVDQHTINEFGVDRAMFMIAPNVGEALKPLTGIASGGELSRVILALKAILAQTDSVETVVFDEVDSGIGGRVAEVVGRKL